MSCTICSSVTASAVPPLVAHGPQDEEVADGARHAQAVGAGVRRSPRAPLSRCPARRRARWARSRSACTVTMRGRVALGDPADGLHLVEGLPHADQAGAAAGRIDDPVGQAPVELLGQLVAHRLLALDAVRLLQRRDVVPAQRFAAFRGHLAGVGDEPVDQRDRGAVQPALVDERLLRVLRDEHLAGEPGGGGVGRRGVAGVAGRRQRDRRRAEGLARA